MSGDYELEDTVFLPFTTRQFSDGVPTALVSGVVDIYEDATTTPIVTAETLAVSLNSHAGFNMITCAATAAQGFNAGGSYTAILDAGTVGGVSVIGEVVGHFTLEMSAAAVDLANGTDGLGAIKTDTAAILADTGTDGVVLAAGAVSATAIATDAIDDDAIATGAIASTAFAAGAINAAAIAAGAIDTDAFTAAAIRQVGGMLVSGTASGAGSSTTLVDTSLTETDDIWTGNWILFTGGTPVIANQCRLITNFDAASDTVTFAPAVAAATDATTTFEIYKYGGADVQSWLGLNAAMAAPNALVGGALEADVVSWLATAVATPTVGGVPEVDITHVEGATTLAELTAAIPAATPSISACLMLLYMALRNELDTTATQKSIKNDAGSVIAKATLSDDGTTFRKTEFIAGP